MTTPESFSTPRLFAERFNRKHLAHLRHLHEDSRVMQYVGGVLSFEETQAGLAFHLSQWEHHGYGTWVLYESKTSQFVGIGGFKNEDIKGHSEPILASFLVPQFWGQGFTTEIGRACLQIATEQLKNKNLFSLVSKEHIAPQRILTKLGFQIQGITKQNDEAYLLYCLNSSSV